MSGEGARFVRKVAKQAAQAAVAKFYLQTAKKDPSMWAFGCLNSDATKITLTDGTIWNVTVSGKPNNCGPCVRIDADTYFMPGAEVPILTVDGSQETPYVIFNGSNFSNISGTFYVARVDKPEQLVLLDFSDIIVQDPWTYTSAGSTCISPADHTGDTYYGAFFSQGGKHLILYKMSQTSFDVTASFTYQGTFDGSPTCNVGDYVFFPNAPFTTASKVSFKIYQNFSIKKQDDSYILNGETTSYTNLDVSYSFTYPPAPSVTCGTSGSISCISGSPIATEIITSAQVTNPGFICLDNLTIFSITGQLALTTAYCIKNYFFSGFFVENFYDICGSTDNATYSTKIQGLVGSTLDSVVTGPFYRPELQLADYGSKFAVSASIVNFSTFSEQSDSIQYRNFFYNNLSLLEGDQHDYPRIDTDAFVCNNDTDFGRDGVLADNSINLARFFVSSRGAAMKKDYSGTVTGVTLYKMTTSLNDQLETEISLGKQYTGTPAGDFLTVVDYTIK